MHWKKENACNGDADTGFMEASVGICISGLMQSNQIQISFIFNQKLFYTSLHTVLFSHSWKMFYDSPFSTHVLLLMLNL